MKKEDLYKAIGELEEKDLESPKKHPKNWIWISAAAAVLAVALCLSYFIPRGTDPDVQNTSEALLQSEPGPVPGPIELKAFNLAAPQYPRMVHYPEEEFPETEAEMAAYEARYDAWRDSIQAQQREPGYADGLSPFFAQTVSTFLTEENGENKVCSPLNIYMALSMLAEITGGDTRQEILEVLGQPDTETLRKQVSDVWNAQYRKDGGTTMILADSLWLNEAYDLKQEPLDILAKDYYASSFSGEPGTEEYDRALQTWINEQTGGLLEEQVKDLKLDPRTIIALASTIYYQAKWEHEFREENTHEDDFFAESGTERADFMHSDGIETYYWTPHFGAVGLNMENGGGTMWLLLPDGGIPPEQLLSEQDTFDFLEQGNAWKQRKDLIVHLAMPKFDVSARLDLKDGLQKMGIRKAFQSGEADFSPVLEDPEGAFVGKCSHGVRVKTDEEGVSAAAYTVMAMCGAGRPPEEEMDFFLNRPFAFVMTSPDGLPLFSGVVNHP